jgi:CubicO group peptidase (beta-lactamase class C family)
MKPLKESEPKLTAQYIQTKGFYRLFYKKTGLIIVQTEVLLQNGKIYEQYEGYSNFRAKTLITKSTPLHIASVSKVITATAILKLVNAKG